MLLASDGQSQANEGPLNCAWKLSGEDSTRQKAGRVLLVMQKIMRSMPEPIDALLVSYWWERGTHNIMGKISEWVLVALQSRQSCHRKLCR